jgi:hypothetical protein
MRQKFRVNGRLQKFRVSGRLQVVRAGVRGHESGLGVMRASTVPRYDVRYESKHCANR